MIQRLRAVDLPIDDIKSVLETSEGADVRDVLIKHRGRLAQEADVLSKHLAVLDELIEKGVDVPAVKGNRIVMINIAVTELDPCRRFYEEALGVEFAQEAHGDGPVHLNATFGEWNTEAGSSSRCGRAPSLRAPSTLASWSRISTPRTSGRWQREGRTSTDRWISGACLASRRFETRAGITSASIRG